VGKYCTVEKVTDDNMAHAHCMLNTQGYKQTLRICNTYCFPTATMVVQKPHFYVIRTLTVFFKTDYVSSLKDCCLSAVSGERTNGQCLYKCAVLYQNCSEDLIVPVVIIMKCCKSVKVKVTLEQATKAQRGSTCIALLFL
jgi:hypothetical protein